MLINIVVKQTMAIFILVCCVVSGFAIDKSIINIGKATCKLVNEDIDCNYKTDRPKKPIPTNQWWSSLISTEYSKYLYAYPLCYRCCSKGLYIAYPDTYVEGDIVYYGNDAISSYRKHILVEGVFDEKVLMSKNVIVESYSDWTVTTKWIDKNDKSKYFTSTLGQGLIFTYFDFSKKLNPRITLPGEIKGILRLYDKNGFEVFPGEKINSDCVTLEIESGKFEKRIYGIFPPKDSMIIFSKWNQIDIEMPEDKRFLSIGVMKDRCDVNEWSKYAYAFVKDAKIYWKVDEKKGIVKSLYKVFTISKQNSQKNTIIALLPHHYKNSSNNQYLKQTFYTLRGNMKLIKKNEFETKNNFNGIIPYLPNINLSNKKHLMELLQLEEKTELNETKIYKYCKQLWKVTSIIPIAEQISQHKVRDDLIERLKLSLSDWYTYYKGKENKYFSYNSLWGGLIAHESEFGNNIFNDHHFHYGYFIYASAILSMYDNSFKKEYKKFIEFLIRDINSPFRRDKYFPFMRSMNLYEGHCYANGLNLSDDGNDQESSSESMNAWAGIYLWGLITNNEKYKQLGIWGYTTEYSAIKEYYFDVDDDIYPIKYQPRAIGILFGGKAKYGIWWNPVKTEYIHGIQFLPITSASLYLGYYPEYIKQNYEYMIYRNNGKEETVWEDTIWLFKALNHSTTVFLNYKEDILTENNLKTYVYHFISNLKDLGNVNTEIFSNRSSYNIFQDLNGHIKYVCYNPKNKNIVFKFYSRNNNEYLGKVNIPGNKMAVIRNLEK